MLQEAIITKIRDDGLAEVVVERLGICGGDCNNCRECRYEHLMKSVVQNPIGARRGYFIAAALGLGESACIIAAFAAAGIGIVIAVVISRARYRADPTPIKIVSVIEPDAE